MCPYTLSFPGGVQRQATGLAAWLRARVARVTLFAPADGPVDVEGFVSLGRSTLFHDNGAATRVAMSPRGFARVAAAVRTGFDLVHLQEPMHPACLAALGAARAPVVGTFHMAADHQHWYRLFGPVVRAAAGRLACRVAVSRAAARFASQALPGSYTVIPNAVDTRSCHPGDIARSGRRVLFIGRPDPRKGLDVLLSAAARMRDHTEIHLAGVSADDLQGVAIAAPRVYAHGRVSDLDLRRLLGYCHVVCTPSLASESFGLTLLEGMAAGLPVVASDLAAHRDVLPPECGRFVPPGDASSLASELDRLLDAPKLCAAMGAAGQRNAARYDWDAVGPRVLRVYREAVDSKASVAA